MRARARSPARPVSRTRPPSRYSPSISTGGSPGTTAGHHRVDHPSAHEPALGGALDAGGDALEAHLQVFDPAPSPSSPVNRSRSGVLNGRVRVLASVDILRSGEPPKHVVVGQPGPHGLEPVDRPPVGAEANTAPLTAPTLVPRTTGATPAETSARSMPTSDAPSTPPPTRTRHRARRDGPTAHAASAPLGEAFAAAAASGEGAAVAMTTIVVGTSRGRGQRGTTRGAEEARLRGARLVVINSARGGRDSTPRTPSAPTPSSRLCAKNSPRRHRRGGPAARARQGCRRRPHRRRRGDLGRFHHHRATPPLAGGQADSRQPRPAHPARRALPGAAVKAEESD